VSSLTFTLRTRALVALVLVGSVVSFGTFGYAIIEKQSLLQSFYFMSMIFTAQGPPSEPKTTAGLVFAALMAYVSIGVLVSSIGFLFGPFLVQAIKDVVRKAEEKFELKNHVIVCGFNEMSRLILESLKERGIPHVLIDQDQSLVEKMILNGVPAVFGDATSTSTLKNAEIGHACSLVACYPDDSKNAFTILTAKQLKPDIFCISRVTQEENVEKLKMVKSDSIVSPTLVGAKMMLEELADQYKDKG
jgi:voltage-gated potassium channel